MLHVLTKDGRKLFSGSKHDVKQFIRKNKLKNYIVSSKFVEKVKVVKPTKPTFDTTDTESYFNQVFDSNV